MSVPLEGSPEELLNDYAGLLDYLADERSERDHKQRSCRGLGNCITCQMRRKAEFVREAAAKLEASERLDWSAVSNVTRLRAVGDDE